MMPIIDNQLEHCIKPSTGPSIADISYNTVQCLQLACLCYAETAAEIYTKIYIQTSRILNKYSFDQRGQVTGTHNLSAAES